MGNRKACQCQEGMIDTHILRRNHGQHTTTRLINILNKRHRKQEAEKSEKREKRRSKRIPTETELVEYYNEHVAGNRNVKRSLDFALWDYINNHHAFHTPKLPSSLLPHVLHQGDDFPSVRAETDTNPYRRWQKSNRTLEHRLTAAIEWSQYAVKTISSFNAMETSSNSERLEHIAEQVSRRLRGGTAISEAASDFILLTLYQSHEARESSTLLSGISTEQLYDIRTYLHEIDAISEPQWSKYLPRVETESAHQGSQDSIDDLIDSSESFKRSKPRIEVFEDAIIRRRDEETFTAIGAVHVEDDLLVYLPVGDLRTNAYSGDKRITNVWDVMEYRPVTS